MPTYDKYRVYCETEVAWVETDYRPRDSGAPTTCPHNNTHTISETPPTDPVIIASISDTMAVTEDGEGRVVLDPTPGEERFFYAPNFCEKCAWWPGATLVEEYSMNSQTQAIWNTSGNHLNWIDLKHGLVTEEDNLRADLAAQSLLGYDVKVETSPDGSTWTERTEDGGDTYDYVIDYPEGQVSFSTALPAGWQVRATFRKADGYEYVIAPDAGKRIKLEYAEAHATGDIVFKTDITRQVWVYNPEDPPNKVLYEQTKYKTLVDIAMDSTVPIAQVPAFGGSEPIGSSGWVRGFTGKSPLYQFPFRYLAYQDLRSSYGAELRIIIDGKWPGTFCNIVAKCTVTDE